MTVATFVRKGERFVRKHWLPFAVGGGVVVAGVAYAATRPKKEAKLTAQQQAQAKQMLATFTAIVNGTAVLCDEHTFWVLHTHKNAPLAEVPAIFYPSGSFSMDEIANHAHCQSNAAAVAQPGLDYLEWFMLHCTYSINPHEDPAGFQAAVNKCIEDNVRAAMKQAAVPGQAGMYMLVVDPSQRAKLIRFARDLAAQNKKPLPSVKGGGFLTAQQATDLAHAAVGAAMCVKLVEMFESSDPKVNPCIKELDFATVFQMFSVTIGTVIGLALGPALSGVAAVVKIATTVQNLAQLSR